MADLALRVVCRRRHAAAGRAAVAASLAGAAREPPRALRPLCRCRRCRQLDYVRHCVLHCGAGPDLPALDWHALAANGRRQQRGVACRRVCRRCSAARRQQRQRALQRGRLQLLRLGRPDVQRRAAGHTGTGRGRCRCTLGTHRRQWPVLNSCLHVIHVAGRSAAERGRQPGRQREPAGAAGRSGQLVVGSGSSSGGSQVSLPEQERAARRLDSRRSGRCCRLPDHEAAQGEV